MYSYLQAASASSSGDKSKNADLVLVEGDASERLSDLRQTRVVILDGKLMDADALRTAAGFSGLPK
jgi:fructose-specific component phosphotransferase system IIB-like protein